MRAGRPGSGGQGIPMARAPPTTCCRHPQTLLLRAHVNAAVAAFEGEAGSGSERAATAAGALFALTRKSVGAGRGPAVNARAVVVQHRTRALVELRKL